MIHAFRGTSQLHERIDVINDKEAICGIDVDSYEAAWLAQEY